ncbi:enoyl-CoA hydratase/isomerase family protein [Fictibacillus sp. S7]|uniref:enoyl-CoA hydratase/isomerase family protein n=1 Tax=Fictibacillus sp. S7 TaxID=2212476 RepID=UPI0010107265|nr:enoyl-CoA hydratase/isomerase family protein [Fictibacillus sp. S7]RXY99373.1 enoyl-CoA hydratase [Fictibacillus sp. S7]
MVKVLYEIKQNIGWITINRPHVRNAVDFEVIQLLENYIDQARHNGDIKILVIRGAGHDVFCAGGDLKAFSGLKTSDEAYSMLSKMGKVLKKLFYFPKPTVALLNGTAVGGGCEIAAACDLRIASANAKVGFIQGTLGITTGWGGGTYLMERIPKLQALDLLWSAGKITAKQAAEKGFLQHLIKNGSLVEECCSYLNRYTEHAVEVLEAYKKVYLDSLKGRNVDKRVEDEIKACAQLWESDVHHHAVSAFFNNNI